MSVIVEPKLSRYLQGYFPRSIQRLKNISSPRRPILNHPLPYDILGENAANVNYLPQIEKLKWSPMFSISMTRNTVFVLSLFCSALTCFTCLMNPYHRSLRGKAAFIVPQQQMIRE